MPTPTRNITLSNVTHIRAENSSYTLARKKDGSIWAWGLNLNGQIGNGTIFPSGDGTSGGGVDTPVQSSVGTGNVIFGTGFNHSLLSVPRIATAAGANVTARLARDVFVKFDNVTAAGTTTFSAIDPTTTGLSVPPGLTIVSNSQAYNISTTTTTTSAGSIITTCVSVPTEFDPSVFVAQL